MPSPEEIPDGSVAARTDAGYLPGPTSRPALRVSEVMVEEVHKSGTPSGGPLRVRLENPDALFVPDHRIQLPVPAPLYLLSCLRLPLETAYPMTEGGVVANPAHAFQRNTIVYPDGSRFEAEVSGSPALGLPNIYDLDYLLGIGSLIDELGPSADGRLEGASYRGILRATRPATERVSGSAKQIAGLKRALARWANTTVRTAMEMTNPGAADDVSAPRTARAPAGAPSRRERESTHWILEYDLEREERNGQTTDLIELLRVNPIWTAQTNSGLASWIRLDLHNSLRSGIAKGIYLRLILAVAQGWRPARHTELLTQWTEALGIQSQDKANKVAASFSRAFTELKEAGAIDLFEIDPVKRGVYEVNLLPGAAICDVADLRGIGTLDPIRTRVLLSHLARYRLEPEARTLLQRHGLRVQDVLQWVHYLRTERGGQDAKGKPIVSWRSWILQALADRWTFDDPEYQQWLARRTEKLARRVSDPTPPLIAPTAAPAPPEPPVAPAPDFTPSDDVWGRALASLQDEIPPPAFRAWFRDSWLEEIGEEIVRVGTRNDFAREWIQSKWGFRLSQTLSRQLGRPVRLILECPPAAPASHG